MNEKNNLNYDTFVLPEDVVEGDKVMEYQVPLQFNPEAKQHMIDMALADVEVV